MRIIKKSLTYFGKLALVTLVCLCIYSAIGFPISKTALADIMPSLITLLSVSLVFYNVNRNQKKSFENETKKNIRDLKIKTADELIDCFAGFTELSLDISKELSNINYTEEAKDKLLENFKSHLIKFNSVVYRRVEIIEYTDSTRDNRLTSRINDTLDLIAYKLVNINQETWEIELRELKQLLDLEMRYHRIEAAEILYKDVLKKLSSSEVNFKSIINYIFNGFFLLKFSLITLTILCVLFYFKKYALHFFIQ